MVIDFFRKDLQWTCSTDNVFPETSLSYWKKARFFSGFFWLPKKVKGVHKKPKFQNLASKKPNWQPCSYELTFTFTRKLQGS